MSRLDSIALRFRETGIYRWYLGREPRERPIIAGLAALVVLLVLWSLVWQPLREWRDREANRYQNAQGLWDFMQANEAAARGLSQSASGAAAERSLLPVITRSANVQGLRLNRLQPEADGAVSVVLQAQVFNSLLTWLNALQENNNVTVQRITIDAEGQPGIVNAQIRLN